MKTKFKILIIAAVVAIVSDAATAYLKRKAKSTDVAADAQKETKKPEGPASVNDDQAQYGFDSKYNQCDNFIAMRSNVTVEVMVEGPSMVKLEVGEVAKSIDALGRRSMFVGTPMGVVALQQKSHLEDGQFDLFMTPGHRDNQYIASWLDSWLEDATVMVVVILGGYSSHENIGFLLQKQSSLNHKHQ